MNGAAPPVLLFLGCLLLASCGGESAGDPPRQDAPRTGERPSGERATPAPPRVPRHVVVYLVDTLRADHLGLHGYARDTSPRLDRFAREAVVFDRAYSNSPWTRTAVVSLFTGLHPESHGVHDKEDAAPDSLVTMAEWFREAGFETAGFSSNISVSAKFLLDQGFEQFTYFPHEPYFAGRKEENPGYVPVSGMFPAIREWLRRPHERPFFLYIHTTDPHFKYMPPPMYRRWGPSKPDMYDGEVLFSDDYFGRLLDLLSLQGMLDETLVIFTADHGEELLDHGQMGHGHSLYNELLRVPLLVRHPSLVPGHRTGAVRLIDILPTLAEWYDFPLELEGVQGRSVLSVLRGASDPWPQLRFVLGQVRYPTKVVGESLEMAGFKMIHTVQDRKGKRGVWELYDMQRDPGERDDRIDESSERVETYRRRLAQLQEETARAAHATRKTTLDEETERTLRALGYIQ